SPRRHGDGLPRVQAGRRAGRRGGAGRRAHRQAGGEGACRGRRLLGRQRRPRDLPARPESARRMTLTGHDRRDLRILLWPNVTSAPPSGVFGFLATPVEASPWVSALVGIFTSVAIATPIAYFELRSARLGVLRRLRRLPLALYFTIKVLFYAIVIVVGLTLA